MKKHLKYIDGTSDKFWQIEVQQTTYTVTYGKNGTKGTSQSKTFESSEECLKAAEKILNEKIKKGYSENGDLQINGTSKVSRESASSASEILSAYDKIVKTAAIDAVLPFMKENSKGNLEILKKQIRKNKRYWLEFIDLSKEPAADNRNRGWGTRGSEQQRELIALSAIALFNKSDVKSWDELFDILNKASKPHILAVLEWAKPNWIGEYLLEKSRTNNWMSFSYPSLRLLENHSLLERSPELYALSIAVNREWTTKIKHREYIDMILNDPIACSRDIPELFNYETMLHTDTFRDNDSQPYNAFNTWEIIFDTILNEGKMKRSLFIEQAILIQTKNWNNALKSFFRKRLTALKPKPEELIPHQEAIFASLQFTYAPIVNFAVSLIKSIYEEKQFNSTSFLDCLEPIMMSGDQKTATKTLLPILEKLNKRMPASTSRISFLIADIYVVPDLALQEKATKTLLKIASTEDQELKDKLSGYVSLMQGAVSNSLTAFLETEPNEAELEHHEPYVYKIQAAPLLNKEVTLPQDWNELLFLFGKFISSDDVFDAELLLNALITQKHLFPEDYSLQLQPYAKQLQNKYFVSKHKAFISVFIQQKIYDYNYVFNVKDGTYNKVKTLLLIEPRLHYAQKLIDTGFNLPMLSFPSHEPHWIAPKVLLERLIAYQNKGLEINALELSIAIGRMPRERVEEAFHLLEQLNGEIKDLMSYCLGYSQKLTIKTESMIDKLFSKIKVGTEQPMKAVWAMAARTYAPEGIFPEFENTYLKSVPFAVAPFRPDVKIDEHWNEYVNYQTKEKERSPSSYELKMNLPGYQQVPDSFIYALDVFAKKGYEYFLTDEGNVHFWHSLTPQNTDALACYLLRFSCNTANGGQELKGFLQIINQPGFRLSTMSMLAFACMFFQEKKEIRLMASEVLINLIENSTIDIKLLSEKIAFLASGKYGPFSRLTESISALKDVSPIHNDAFFQLTEGIFRELDFQEKLPLNFKKMVETYIDVLYKIKQRPSAEIINSFEKLKDNASLKALVKQIISN